MLSSPPFLPVILADANDAASRQWSLGHEGISPAWAALLFAVLALGAVLAYLRWAPAVSRGRKSLLIALRIFACAVVVALLVKPVLHLTLQEKVRQPLLVLLDHSDSMNFPDRRTQEEDVQRAAIATGDLPPDSGLAKHLDSATTGPLTALPRRELLQRLAANEKLNLWPKLSEQSDLLFYQFGRQATPASMPNVNEGRWKTADATAFFQDWKPDAAVTGIGESLRQVLQEPRPQAPGAVLLITDGGSNSGSSPIEAAQIARENGVPLFIYGIGVTSPLDLMVREASAQKLAFVGERMEVKARLASQSFEEKSVVATLMAGGEAVDKQDVTLGGDREVEVVFHVTPKAAGELKLEVSIPLLPEEAGRENNTAAITTRVTDSKFQVLLIEQEPRWDFRYLLDYLQRDPRLEVKCVMIDGEPGLETAPGSPFLPKLPETRDTFFKSHVIILGDVKPEDLGQERMRTIAEWVEAGGGIIFLTGPNFNPRSYMGTPLEPLLPVVPDTLTPKESVIQRTPEPFKLSLTRLGENSPYLQMDPDPEVNKQIWAAFPGVRWTAPVARVKAGAEVLLVDPRPERAGRYGALPVFAMQGYGAGKCVYFGTDETYRWRSRTGEKYYSILWGQIMQTLSLQLLEGASPLTQLKTDRKQYRVGDRVVIAGNAYTEGYAPLLEPTLPGSLSIATSTGEPKTRPLSLHATEKNTFRGDFIAETPGSYTFASQRDPEGTLRFEVLDAHLERSQTAMDQKLLKGMADVSGGRFMREENLHELPALIASKAATVTSFQKLEIYRSGWFLAALMLFLFLEWLLRRLFQLK